MEQRDLKEGARTEDVQKREREAREAAAYAHSLEAELAQVLPPNASNPHQKIWKPEQN